MGPSPGTESIKARFATIGARRPTASPAPRAIMDLPVTPRAPVPDLPADPALDLLTDMAKLLPELVARCEQIAAAIAAARVQSRDDLAEVTDVTLQWQNLAQKLKAHTEDLSQSSEAFRRRAEAADADVERLTAAAAQLRAATNQASAYNLRMQQKIQSAFGAGTPGRAALQRGVAHGLPA